MSAIACPSCGSGSHPGAAYCWLCGAALGPNAAPAVATHQAQAQAPQAQAQQAHYPGPAHVPPHQMDRSQRAGCGWIVGVVVAVFVMLMVGAEVGYLAPGLLIPYAILMVPVLIVLGRMLYIQIFKQKAPGTGDEHIGTKIAAGIAMGFLGMVAVVGVIMLLFIAAIVILFMICFAAIATGQ